MSPHPLDDPVRSSLLGPHASLAVRAGSAIGYRPDVAAFAAWTDDAAPDDRWADLARLRGPGGSALVVGGPDAPADWTVAWEGEVLRMAGDRVAAEPDPGLLPLGVDDVPEMAALVARTRPGPFLARTIEFGGYLGLRDADGRLIAMAGERMHPPGHAEVSAVCTDPDHRGRGLGARLVRAVSAGILARGDAPFLHVAATNPAVALYARLGFTVRDVVTARHVVVPGAAAIPPAAH